MQVARIGFVSNSINFNGGASVFLDGYSSGYRNGVDNQHAEDFDNDYKTTWERTLYEASYDKGYAQGKSEQGKSIWDLEYRSVYTGDRDEYTCQNIYYNHAHGIHFDCVDCNMDVSDCSAETPSNISEEVKSIANEECISLPEAQNYIDITKNNTL